MTDCSLILSENSMLSNNEEGVPGDLNHDALSQEPDTRSPGRGGAFNKLPQQNRGFQKLVLVAGDEKPYKCVECGKSFKHYARLLQHLQTHRRKNMFECIECGKSFNRKGNLMVHQRVHTGERPYKCEQCEKTFCRSSNLAAHHKTHAKKKAFSCTTCKKKFGGSTALFHHQRVHMDEKPYRCTKCGNSFRLWSSFIKHQQIHFREEPSEHTADANYSEWTSLHHKGEQGCGAGEPEKDGLNLVLEELKKMRENMDMLLLNQQSQLQVLQEIQKQLNILLPGNDLINSNVYSLGLMLGRQVAAAASLSFPLLNPSRLLPENDSLLSQSSAPGVLPATQLPGSLYPATSTA
ncbi:uncharacterized protein LJ264_011898 [Porphyrio hochstetteri]